MQLTLSTILGWFGLAVPRGAPEVHVPAAKPVPPVVAKPTTAEQASAAYAYCKEATAIMNRVRAGAGLGQVQINWLLYEGALDKAQANAEAGKLSHGLLKNPDTWAVIRNSHWTWGECLDEGDPTPEAAITRLLNDPPHRKIMLDPRWNSFGAAFARDGKGIWFAAFEYGVYH